MEGEHQIRKQFLTKTLGVLCATIITFVSAYMLAACGTMYHSKAGTMQDMIGTYQLTTYKQKDDDGNEIDRIKQLHVQAYMVVGADGHGYYYYQDDTTPYWYDTTLIRYTKDNENSNLYKAIQVTKGVSDRDTKIDRQKPGNGYEPQMGFNVNTKTFNYSISDDRHPRYTYPSYYTNVVYTKISNDTSLNKVARETHRTLDPLPIYELKNLDGVLVYRTGNHQDNPEYQKYQYCVVDFDAVNRTADLYYQLTDGTEPQQQNDVPITVNVTSRQDDYNNTLTRVSLNIFGQTFDAPINFASAPSSVTHEVNSAPNEDGSYALLYSNWFEKYRGDKTSLEEIIADPMVSPNQY